jgi:hypothetical protein
MEQIISRFAVYSINALARFLYADPSPSALQVFLRRPGATIRHTVLQRLKSYLAAAFERLGATGTRELGLPAEQGREKGIWVNADPIPGCVVCNIGESEYFGCVLTPLGMLCTHYSVGDLDEWSVPLNPPSCCPPRIKLSVRSTFFFCLPSLI